MPDTVAFSWSAPSFASGVSAALDVSTIVTATLLWHKKGRSKFYAWLAAVAFVHAVDLVIRTVVTEMTITSEIDPATGVFVYKDLTAITLTLNVVFYAVGAARMPVLTKMLVALTATSVLTSCALNAVYIYCFIGLFLNGEQSAFSGIIEKVDSFMFSSWSIFDSLVNASISLAFYTFLKRLNPTPSNKNDPNCCTSLRKGFPEMLTRVTWILGLECTLMVAANLFVVIFPTADPLLVSIYISESVRLRMFVSFFVMLSHMLQKQVVSQHAGAGAAGHYAGGGSITINSQTSMLRPVAGGTSSMSNVGGKFGVVLPPTAMNGGGTSGAAVLVGGGYYAHHHIGSASTSTLVASRRPSGAGGVDEQRQALVHEPSPV
ncbi:hypothetical protein BCR44DRAFT_1494961 [Catenaria anguillulae PL171]|uniref:Uncharacterized protein n=1 Tax=Catenaria anguillulae PL171 TaxID=765915 RepID=A0A1Y2I3M1_9FUNG|nr:hypothetical protein BCR44DRAFT_1494961 [Catenaria anguillulae PL171]